MVGKGIVYYALVLINCRSAISQTHNTPCAFNTMCFCWVQDDKDFTKMDISCLGVPFARFPGEY